MDAQKRLGQRIREHRKERRMSQTELAQRAGVALMTISRLEWGEHDPHVRTLSQIAKGLGVPLFELMRSAGYFENDDPDRKR
jgi:XRE family transcriptional regulator, aerobic/anaerobic benzoate catabolism transcriptional regulator